MSIKIEEATHHRDKELEALHRRCLALREEMIKQQSELKDAFNRFAQQLNK